MSTITVIDTFGFFFRAYYALPGLRNSRGEPTGLLTGFANFIHSLSSDHPSDYILFALDSKGKTFRHDIDESYKANRSEPPEDLKKQLPIAIEWIKKMGFAQFSQEGYEADDVIASMVKFAKKADHLNVRIVTHDKDLYQLIEDGKVTIFDPSKKREIDVALCVEKFGLPPSKIRDYLSLTGDTADNIPGVKGIGAVGAKKLLDEFGSLQGIYDNLEKVRNERTRELLRVGEKSAFLSMKLTSLDDTLEVHKQLELFLQPEGEPLLRIRDELKANEMFGILARIKNAPPIESKKEPTEFTPILLDTRAKLDEVLSRIHADALVAFDTETDSLDSRHAGIVGFSFCFEEDRAYYVPIHHFYLGVGPQVAIDEARDALVRLFSRRIIGQNIKFDKNVITKNFALEIGEVYADTMVMGWLMDSDSAVGMDSLAKRLLGYTTIKFADVVPRKATFAGVELEAACAYAAEDAWVTLRLYHKMANLLEPHLMELARSLEFPFIDVIRDMEIEGIKVDPEYLRLLLERADSQIVKLGAEIFELCGERFNLNSPIQMGVVLFEHMGLKSARMTAKKGSYSTDEATLTDLIDAHPAIAKILDYRELYKLRSTYLEPLMRLGLDERDSRVHTNFLQTGTATGRLSSRDPNLQNIPVRTELGRAVRSAFVAREGYKLVGLDYSQIELRLLAHFSGDEALVGAFLEDKDIHLETAVKLFGDEALAKRNIAKSINFGLLYGMGSRKLAKQLGVSQAEAKGYIDSYFASFPTVKSYMASIEEGAKEHGYIKTLLGRRRNFDYANASPMQLASYGREAINAVFQGSAADLIKLAMLKIKRELLGEKATLLLQIHDELIFEVEAQIAEEFAKKAAAMMGGIYDLKVPLKTSVSIGDNWGQLK
jgi:DNA polymerase-1